MVGVGGKKENKDVDEKRETKGNSDDVEINWTWEVFDYISVDLTEK